MFKNNLLLISLSLVIFVSCKGDVTHKKNQSPKNIILLISDGAGLSQISSAYFYKNEPVNYSRFNDIGLIETFSSNKDITDSAASATAFATGEKTYNGAIGVSKDYKPVNNLIELASLKGVKLVLFQLPQLHMQLQRLFLPIQSVEILKMKLQCSFPNQRLIILLEAE